MSIGKRKGISALGYAGLILLPIGCLLISLMIGAYSVSPLDTINILAGKIFGKDLESNKMAVNMVWQVRLPRILGGMLVGAGLAVCGAVFQGLFRNPLASPYTLGVSNGAGFGAALAILLYNHPWAVQGNAMIFGMIAVGFTFLLALKAKNSSFSLVLGGVIVGGFFASLVSLIKFAADPLEKLPAIVFWLMGSLSTVSYQQLLSCLPIYGIAMLVLVLYRWKINVLSLGEQEARSYGVDVKKDRAIVIICCSAITSVVVSIGGVIGWVGLVIPHIARMIVGPDFRKLIPVSLSLGACYLVIIDDICRALTSFEIPLGIVTAIIGTPIFVSFIFRGKVRW
jgi:iron complex transport system permease protein